jgi:hemolysin III
MLSQRAAMLTAAVTAPPQGQPWKIVGFSIYGATLVSLFMCSTLHHGLEGPPAMERGLRIADYCAIYPLISGASLMSWAS